MTKLRGDGENGSSCSKRCINALDIKYYSFMIYVQDFSSGIKWFLLSCTFTDRIKLKFL